jgi:hypothetical protein
MPYFVLWQLHGRSERLLDRGCLEDVHTDYGSAVFAIDCFLRSYAEVGRNHERGYWWARRSSDADLEMRIWVGMHAEEPGAGPRDETPFLQEQH